jgi:putative transposase
MRRGFLHLAAVMDWATRKAPSWRVSNTLDVEFCLEALEEAMARSGRPGIFDADQGGQSTSPRFTGLLQAAGVRISMDGRGRWLDNVLIERLRRSLKCERVYLHAFEAGSELPGRAHEADRLLQRRTPTQRPGGADPRRGVRGR